MNEAARESACRVFSTLLTISFSSRPGSVRVGSSFNLQPLMRTVPIILLIVMPDSATIAGTLRFWLKECKLTPAFHGVGKREKVRRHRFKQRLGGLASLQQASKEREAENASKHGWRQSAPGAVAPSTVHPEKRNAGEATNAAGNTEQLVVLNRWI